MDLYDDLDTKQRTNQVDGWSSGIKLLQTQLALKKAVLPTPGRRDAPRKATILAPVINLKTKKDNEFTTDIFKPTADLSKTVTTTSTTASTNLIPLSSAIREYDWDVVDEYDPLWPNDYEKLIKDRRDKEKERNRDRDRKRRSSRFTEDTSPPPQQQKFSGFGGRPDHDDEARSPPQQNSSRSAGAAIAPPPSLQAENSPPHQSNNSSLQESKPQIVASYGASSVAAKIMAKYGFREGQGLGKQEQGMSIALQVEKTSKRGGRIIHEKELMLPPPAASSPPIPTAANVAINTNAMPPPASLEDKKEPTITEIMKSPSKVVLLRNMVGPGDVDCELEPEVKDECNTKYGEVISVVIHEFFNVPADEAIRIFVEFKRIESAIKAVVDLNGRFFGGRQVKAGFYNFDRFKGVHLTD